MTGSRDQPEDFKPIDGGVVTYRSGEKGRISGVGTLNIARFPKLKNVSFVEVYDRDGTLIMRGKRYSTNYLIKGEECLTVTVGDHSNIAGKTEEENVEGYMEMRSSPSGGVSKQNSEQSSLRAEEEEIRAESTEVRKNLLVQSSQHQRDPPTYISKRHPLTNLVGDVEPKNVQEALKDEF